MKDKHEYKDVSAIKINIPIDLLLKLIEEFKKKGNWDDVASEFKFSNNTLINRVKEFLGHEKYKKLLLNYSLAYNISFALSKDRTRVQYLSKEVRNTIIGHLYFSLTKEANTSIYECVNLIVQGIKQEESWTKSIPVQIFLDFKARIKLESAKLPLLEYLISLVKILKRLIKLNEEFKDEKSPLIIKHLTKDLFKENVLIGINTHSFENLLSEIIDFLRFQFTDFSLERLKGGVKLYNDPVGKLKECGRCHKIKTYDDFSLRGKNTLGKHNSVCKECSQIIFSIRRYKKKYDVIKALYGEIKCCNLTCELQSDITFLPSLNFHHKNPNQKTVSWSKIYSRSFDYIIKVLSNEEIIVLCDNCHIRIDKHLFNKYQNIILGKNLFYKTSNEIKCLIKNSNIRQNVEYWFKKRYLIEQLFDGKCVGCGKINVYNNLPALTFHHRDPKIKEESWSKNLRFLEIKKIVEIMKKKDMICLCANCHRFLYSTQFTQNYHEIFLKIGIDDSTIKKMGKILETLIKNIKGFKPKSIKIDYLL